MAGSVFLSAELSWDVSSWDFYWAVETLAGLVRGQDLANHLREISEYHLGILDVSQLSEDQRRDLARSAAGLPGLAREVMTDTARIARIEELAALFPPG
ncbi:hypothetical protein KIH74_24980 [Kineosporia sp. J2-2]|uniref:Uncharacterized protein n=1 Tax=Kineosporia corallincola TaxID=2835133 RepID=A0ABS5TN06_9ACTN|nr:hypothetical protein [Kineosporia corallincola]MBT0772223.1 hypothetical protein [Kineosporia corallincola]